jgi:hypothetical protein
MICEKCGHKIGIISICYFCNKKEYYKIYYEINKQKFLEGGKKRYDDIKSTDDYKSKVKNYQQKHKEDRKKYMHNYYIKNYEKMRTEGKIYYEENKIVLNKKQYEKKKIFMKNNPIRQLEEVLRSRIAGAIKHHKGTKETSSLELLGTDINTVRRHLEKQFLPGMTWGNHGITGWHIDHIKSCSSFDLSKEEEQRKCFHYTNLQPLWYIDNIRKDKHNLININRKTINS